MNAVRRIGIFATIVGVLTLLLLCQPAGAQESGAPAAGTQPASLQATGGSNDAGEAVRTFLALVDAGKYDDCWEAAASPVKNVMKKESWDAMIGANRAKVGKLESRRLESDEPATSIPGAPDGKYQVYNYASVFRGRKGAETVTAMQDEDGKWRVLRYSVRLSRR